MTNASTDTPAFAILATSQAEERFFLKSGESRTFTSIAAPKYTVSVALVLGPTDLSVLPTGPGDLWTGSEYLQSLKDLRDRLVWLSLHPSGASMTPEEALTELVVVEQAMHQLASSDMQSCSHAIITGGTNHATMTWTTPGGTGGLWELSCTQRRPDRWWRPAGAALHRQGSSCLRAGILRTAHVAGKGPFLERSPGESRCARSGWPAGGTLSKRGCSVRRRSAYRRGAMARRTLPWLPWLLAEGTLVWLQARLWPYGGLWLLLVWTAVLLLYRTAVVQISRLTLRLVGDLVFAGLCALAVFEGGWYLLPAVVLFAVADAAGVSASLPSLPGGHEGKELGAALASTVVGWLAVAFFLSGPLYGSASSTIGPNGTTVNSGPATESLLQVGLTGQAAVVLAACAVLFGLVTVLVLVHIKIGRDGAWRLLVGVTIALLALVVLGAWTVGLWLVPGAALALLAVRLGRPGQVTASGT